MSRLGDTIRTNRLRLKITPKALAKKSGTSESFILEVESGRRIVSDEMAQRILKVLGAEGPLSAELAAAEESAPPPPPKRVAPRPYTLPTEPPAPSPTDDAPKDAWLDALSGLVKRVPVVDEAGEVIEHRLLPVIGGAIEGAAPDKVIYFRCPDDSLRGFRIHAGDLLLTVPQKTPVDGALMLLMLNNRRTVRKIKKLEGGNILLQQYGKEFSADTLPLRDINFIGRCVRLEADL